MIKRFISYYKPHKKLFFIDMFIIFLILVFKEVFIMVFLFSFTTQNLRI